MKQVRIDRERLIKVAAVAGLVVLGLSVLPGLLKTPKPPELPPDVGFTASETGPAALLPDAVSRPRPGVRKKEASRKNRRVRPAVKRTNDARKTGGKRRRKRPRKQPDRAKNAPGPEESPASAPPAPASSAPPPDPVASAPAPAPVAPPAPPPPAPTPAPGPPPGDGSQEFAPR